MLVKQKIYREGIKHEDTLLSAIKWWIFKKNKYCNQFCPTCEFYFRCQEDVNLVNWNDKDGGSKRC